MLRTEPRLRSRRAHWIALAVALAACTTASADWWTFQHDAGRTGYVRGGMGRNPQPFWNAPLVMGTTSLTAPVLGAVNDSFRVFIGSGYGDRKLYALSPHTGAQLWTFTASANTGFFGAPTAANDNVYAATKGNTPHVYAVRQVNGAPVWQTPLPGTGSGASVAVQHGMVFVNTDQHVLHAFAQGNGALVWSANTSPGATSQESSPAVGFGRVYVGSDDGLFAFDVGTGAQAWKYNLTAIVGFSSPVIDTATPRLVFIGTNDMKLHAVNATTGAGVWTYTASATLAFSSVAVAQGKVFVFDYTKVVALDRNTGALVWTHVAGSIPRHSPAIARDVLFYSDNQAVVGLNINTGAPVWKAPIPGNGAQNAPGADMAIGLEILLVPNKGHVHAFR
ncbi:MAG: PQQ-binding-like beta-propeller repeat protein [Gemmatimonadaceae bacterium]